MRFAQTLFAVSLALNAAWLGGVLLGDATEKETPASPQAAVSKGTAPETGPPETRLQAAFRSHDLAALRDELRLAGCPDDELRAILGMRAWKRAQAAAHVLAGAASPDPRA
jgi:hypothetical protein